MKTYLVADKKTGHKMKLQPPGVNFVADPMGATHFFHEGMAQRAKEHLEKLHLLGDGESDLQIESHLAAD